MKVRGPAERKIEAALKSPTQLEFVDTPLSDVIDYLKDYHQIEIQLDKKAMEEAGTGSDTPVTKNLKGVSLKSALRLMLNDLSLTYVIKDEVLYITTKEAAENQLTTRVYSVADLVIPIRSPNFSGGFGGMGGFGGFGGSGGGFGGGMNGAGGMGGIGQGGMGGFGGGQGGFVGGGGGMGMGGGGASSASPPKSSPSPRRWTGRLRGRGRSSPRVGPPGQGQQAGPGQAGPGQAGGGPSHGRSRRTSHHPAGRIALGRRSQGGLGTLLRHHAAAAGRRPRRRLEPGFPPEVRARHRPARSGLAPSTTAVLDV